jgi:DNA-directed RNA polymerase specialized sigma24 family protein
MSEQIIAQVHEESFEKFVARGFRRLSIEQREDIVQLAFVEALAWSKKDDVDPAREWQAWIWNKVKQRSKDFIKSAEYRYCTSIDMNSGRSSGAGIMSPIDGLTPSHTIKAEQKRKRGEKLLSDVLCEFVLDCESETGKSESKRKCKEAFERRLRGQSVEQIAEAMGISRAAVSSHRSRAVKEIANRSQQKDVNQSVLPSLMKINATPGETSTNEDLSEKQLSSLVRLVVEGQGALCPSEKRLAAYRLDPYAPGYEDVHYHVIESAWHWDEQDNQQPGCWRCQEL